MIRARRGTPAVLVALVILALCVVISVAVLQQLSGHRPFIPFAALAAYGQRLHFDDIPVIVAGAVATALGLIVLACAAIPGKPTVLPLAPADGQTAVPTLAGVRRTALGKALRATARDLDGVVAARIRVRPRRITVRLRTEDTDTDVVAGSARAALGRRLDETDLARPVRLRIKVTRVRGRNVA